MPNLHYQLMQAMSSKSGGYKVGELALSIPGCCRECGGETKDSKILVNSLVSFNDFGGDVGKRGTTQSRVGIAKLQDGKKCVKCGHSYIP